MGTNSALSNGSGLNLFSNPQAVFNSVRPVLLGKTTHITERVTTRFSVDFFNIFNHPNFANPSLSYTSPQAFGVITSTFTPPNRTNSARWIEFGLRVEF